MADAEQPFSPQQSRSPVPAPVSGFLLGAVAGLCLAAAFGYPYAARKARQGWNLVPVIVAAADLPAGSVITYDVISQRPVPEQFATPSLLRPDHAAEIINLRLRVPLSAGDPIHTAYFEAAPAGAQEQPVKRLPK